MRLSVQRAPRCVWPLPPGVPPASWRPAECLPAQTPQQFLCLECEFRTVPSFSAVTGYRAGRAAPRPALPSLATHPCTRFPRSGPETAGGYRGHGSSSRAGGLPHVLFQPGAGRRQPWRRRGGSTCRRRGGPHGRPPAGAAASGGGRGGRRRSTRQLCHPCPRGLGHCRGGGSEQRRRYNRGPTAVPRTGVL